MASWARKNLNKPIPQELIDTRTKRFKKAFEYMFDDLEFEGVEDNITPIFKKSGQETSIDIYELSSGEKQIVLRGSFLLKDKNALEGVIALIEEPESSMHPRWQAKIFDYYTKLFKNEQEEQTSQIFMVTHSDYVLKRGLQDEDTLVIKLSAYQEPEFYHSHTNQVPENFVLDSLTTAELVYRIFGIASVEFHQLLFEKMLSLHETNFSWFPGYKDIGNKYCILKRDGHDVKVPETWTQPDSEIYKTSFLPLYIRNYIDHSADKNSDGNYSRDGICISEEYLTRSIQFMIDKISEYISPKIENNI